MDDEALEAAARPKLANCECDSDDECWTAEDEQRLSFQKFSEENERWSTNIKTPAAHRATAPAA